jgi:oligopeptidase B
MDRLTVGMQAYPNILVTAGLHDPRVQYWEPAKYVAKLRLKKTNSNMLLLKCELGAGHFSHSGRFDLLRELATSLAFLLVCHHKCNDPVVQQTDALPAEQA